MQLPLCSVPSGVYLIGDSQLATSKPAHQVTLDAFAIMTHAVSNALYAAFIAAGAYRGAQDSHWSEFGLRWRRHKQPEHPAFWRDPRFNAPDQPVVGVSWYEALAFTRWLSAETGDDWYLPSEAQWEAAARAGDDDAPPSTVVIHTAASGLARPLSVLEGHVAACGAVNMLGNVWEWCSTRWGRNWQSLDYPYPYQANDGREDLSGSHARVMRGGSWFDPPHASHVAHRARYLPGSRGSNIGFRLLRILDE